MSERTMAILPLELESLRFQAGGQTLVDGLSATIEHPGLTVLLGPNGAGKTLLLRMLCGLLKPSAGTIRWAGGRIPPLGPGVGYVAQQPAMLRRHVHANLAYAVDRLGLPRAEREARIAEATRLAGLEGRERDGARTLSGGQRQRLAIARAWSQRPAALLLDEPCVHLDPAAALAIEELIAGLRDRGTKILLTTHDLNQARRLADDVLFLHRGRLLEQAPAARFFAGPESAEAADFVSGELLAA